LFLIFHVSGEASDDDPDVLRSREL
jgi:hypothetical protein